MASLRIVSIEGNIGSGKSTLMSALRSWAQGEGSGDEIGRRLVFLNEPVDAWQEVCDRDGDSILAKFYRDPCKYAFPFQMMAYITRLVMLKEVMEANPDMVVVCERSIFTDRNVFASMLHDDGHIEDVNFLIYTKWFDAFSAALKLEDMSIVYVDTSPTVCMSRVLQRARPGEVLSLAYLQKCDEYHRKWLQPHPDVLVLPGDEHKHNTHTIDTGSEHSNGVYAPWIERIVGRMRERL